MKHLAAAILIGLGVLAVLFGLLFIVGAAGRPARYAIGGISLTLGAVVAGFGVRLFRKAQAEHPDRIGAEIMHLAEQKNGELSSDDLRALLGERFLLAAPVLANLRDAGICRPREASGAVFYTFPDLQPRLTMRRCEFCEAELPLDDAAATCPHCGGQIKTQVARLAVSDEEFYGLDE